MQSQVPVRAVPWLKRSEAWGVGSLAPATSSLSETRMQPKMCVVAATILVDGMYLSCAKIKETCHAAPTILNYAHPYTF